MRRPILSKMGRTSRYAPKIGGARACRAVGLAEAGSGMASNDFAAKLAPQNAMFTTPISRRAVALRNPTARHVLRTNNPNSELRARPVVQPLRSFGSLAPPILGPPRSSKWRQSNLLFAICYLSLRRSRPPRPTNLGRTTLSTRR